MYIQSVKQSAKQPGSGTAAAPSLEFALNDREFDRIASFVRARTGIVLGRQKKTMVYGRLVRRLRALGLQSFKAYCELLSREEGQSELPELANAITTNLTKFFREAHHFEHLRDVAIPEALAQDAGGRRLRVWSAGCSTGEEPYSIAMMLAAHAPKLVGWDTRILATDLDTAVLAKARAGNYSDNAIADVPERWRKLHLRPLDIGPAWKIDPKLGAMIAFKKLNLLGPWPIKGPFDAIFCRNVMIYFDNPTKQKLVERLAEKLKPGGWLYIGHSETLLDKHPNLRLTGRTIYQKSQDAA